MQVSDKLIEENQELKSELQFYKGIVDNICVSIYINDVSYESRYPLLWSNNYHKKMVELHIKERDDNDAYYENHYNQEDEKLIYESVKKFKETKEPFAILHTYRMSEDDQRWIYAIGDSFNTPRLNGEPMLCVAVDLTDKVVNTEMYLKMQKEILSLKHDLAVAKLSDTEIEILKLLAEGKSEADIADKKCRSIFTIKKHFQNIREKLQVKKNTQLVRFAVEVGMV